MDINPEEIFNADLAYDRELLTNLPDAERFKINDLFWQFLEAHPGVKISIVDFAVYYLKYIRNQRGAS